MSDTHAQTVAFVRDTQIPPSPPPAREAGAVKWVRENLFSGWVNSILTILSIYFVYKIVSGAWPWFANGVWGTTDLATCRQILSAEWDATIRSIASSSALTSELGLAERAALGLGSLSDATTQELASLLSALGISHPEGPNGACFSVLQDRWRQMVFGIAYPEEGYWRPVLAFVLLIVAAAPVLFSKLPRKLLIFSAIYPFLAYWLIWGGTILIPLVVMAGFVVGFYAFIWAERNFSFAAGLAVFVVSAGAVWWLGIGTVSSPSGVGIGGWPFLLANLVGLAVGCAIFAALRNAAGSGAALVIAIGFAIVWWALVSPFVGLRLAMFAGFDSLTFSNPLSSFIALPEVPSRDMGGFMLNMILGTICVSLSLPLGIVLALGRQSSMPIIKGICVVFIEFIRGVPLITLLFVANVVLAYFFPPGTNLDLILRVIIMITMFSAAYIAEVIRGGLAALPKGQYEAGDSLGLNYSQSMRLIILPQALKISIPGIVNVAVGLFKDTTLVSVISMFDMVGVLRGPILSSTAWTGIYWEAFGFAALLFFIVCYGISQYSQWLERQLRTDHR